MPHSLHGLILGLIIIAGFTILTLGTDGALALLTGSSALPQIGR